MANRKVTKKERFVKVAEVRTQRVLDALHSLGKCAAPESYEYTEEDVQKIVEAIEKEVQWVRDCFTGKNRFTLSQDEESEE